MIHKSPLPDVEIPDVHLTGYLLQHADRLHDKPALIDGPSGRALTFGQLADSVAALAGGLAAHGFGPGDVLALIAPNVPEYAVIFLAVARAGGAITTVNPTFTAGEISRQLTDSGASMLVTVPGLVETAHGAIAGTTIDTVYVLGEADGATPLRELFGAPLDEQVEVGSESVVVLPYSSGTTGFSKGVMLTHHNLIANIEQTITPVELREDETSIAVLPFFHIYGMQVLMNAGLRVGMTVVTMPRFDLPEFLRIHQDYGVTRSFVAPPIVVALAKHPIVDNYDMSKLEQIFSGAAPLSAEVAAEAGARLGCEVVQGYGMTELSPVSHVTPKGQFKPGSVGLTVPNTETMIVDPATGNSVGIGEDGEVCVRGPQVMKGYLNNEQATRATIDKDGWLHTGDIGHIDEDGHLYVVDRLKELIKYKGFQVAPAELEALLLTHPAIADAAVIGLPDEESGELPVGYVVMKHGHTASEQEIMEFVAGQVAHYKQLRKLTKLDAIPKSASGKILRRVLKDEALA